MCGSGVWLCHNFQKLLSKSMQWDISELFPRLLTSLCPRYQLKLFSRLHQLKFCLPRFETQFRNGDFCSSSGKFGQFQFTLKIRDQSDQWEAGFTRQLDYQPISTELDCVPPMRERGSRQRLGWASVEICQVTLSITQVFTLLCHISLQDVEKIPNSLYASFSLENNARSGRINQAGSWWDVVIKRGQKALDSRLGENSKPNYLSPAPADRQNTSSH